MQGKSLVLKNTDHRLYIFCKLHTHKFIQLQDIKLNLELTEQAVVRARDGRRATAPTRLITNGQVIEEVLFRQLAWSRDSLVTLGRPRKQ